MLRSISVCMLILITTVPSSAIEPIACDYDSPDLHWEYLMQFDAAKVDQGLEEEFNPAVREDGIFERRFGNKLMKAFRHWTKRGGVILAFQVNTDSAFSIAAEVDMCIRSGDDEWPVEAFFVVRYRNVDGWLDPEIERLGQKGHRSSDVAPHHGIGPRYGSGAGTRGLSWVLLRHRRPHRNDPGLRRGFPIPHGKTVEQDRS